MLPSAVGTRARAWLMPGSTFITLDQFFAFNRRVFRGLVLALGTLGALVRRVPFGSTMLTGGHFVSPYLKKSLPMFLGGSSQGRIIISPQSTRPVMLLMCLAKIRQYDKPQYNACLGSRSTSTQLRGARTGLMVSKLANMNSLIKQPSKNPPILEGSCE